MKRAIVVGSGAGGATAAKELQGKFEVTILEAGGAFRPFAGRIPPLETMKEAGLMFDERLMPLLFPALRVRKTPDMVLVNGIGVGGTTTVCCGNALRVDGGLAAVGVNLDEEFAEVYREVPVTDEHQDLWREPTRHLFDASREMGLEPRPLPKMGDYGRCRSCGRCVLGCPHGVKWDSRRFVAQAVEAGARLVTRSRVVRVVLRNGRAAGVEATSGGFRRFYPADLVVLAAGGLGTPLILANSGIPCEPRLSVDPVLCVATRWPGSRQHQELSMPFVVQRDHFILSPYFDYLSFFFNRDWRHPAGDTLGLMIKLADSSLGEVSRRGVRKSLTALDRARLEEGVSLCRELFRRLGVNERETFRGTVNAGHPGGTLPLTEREAESLHPGRLPANLYVADATLLPEALGNPPILTLIALAKQVSRAAARQFAG